MLSIEQILPRARLFYPNRPAVNGDQGWVSFEQLGRRVDALAGALAQLGMVPGDRVAVLDVNSVRYLEAYYASAQAGFTLVPLNSRLSAPEVDYILNDCAAKVLIVSNPFYSLVESLANKLPSVSAIIGYGSAPSQFLDYEVLISRDASTASYSAKPQDIAQIYYTSGTTGEPKGVCLTYGNMAVSATDAIVSLGLTWRDSWLHAAPLFHLVDAWAVWAMPLLGAPQIAIHFTPDLFLTEVERWKPTATALPPTLINLLCSHPDLVEHDLKSLRMIMYGGSPMPLGILAAAKKAIPTEYVHAYGITETSGILTVLRGEDCHPAGTPDQIKKTGSGGHSVISTRVEIFGESDDVLPPDAVGEIVVRGPRVMAGYWNKPTATSDALRGGWYRTGDLGMFDDERNLYIVDRKKDMIISGGENIYSVEVESIISTHSDVAECAVIGIPSEQWGEAVHAIIFPKPNTSPSEDELLSFCRGKIASYKIPKSISFSQQTLPKTGPGKIAKRQLREAFWQGHEKKI